MAKALSLRKDRTKGTQRTRKLSTGNVRGMLRKWEGTLREAFLGEWTEGAEPCKVKALSTVLNGGREETCRKVTRLAPTHRLTGMAKALSEQMDLPESQALSFEERLGLLVDREMTARSDRRLTTRLRQAKLRLSASLEDIDYRHPRGLDKSLILRLASCQWVHEHHNVLITGPTGIGKPQPGNYPCRSQRITGTHHYRYRSPSPTVWPDPHACRSDTPQ